MRSTVNEADAVRDDVAQWPSVENAYRDAVPRLAQGCNTGYEVAAPAGVDVGCAQANAASLGLGLGAQLGHGAALVDVEIGWTRNHVALQSHNIPPPIVGVEDVLSSSHGTSVLGVVCGDDPAGFTGIAPGVSSVRVASCKPDNATPVSNESVAEAIAVAAATVRPGDVILIEMQSPEFLPCEAVVACFESIAVATALGIVVVEPAGNGNTNLDGLRDPLGGFPFRRGGILPAAYAPFDSKAILVASADSAVPHSRRANSNFGSRVDCYAWGDSVLTATSAGPWDLASYAPPCFVDTSAAAAIIAGITLAVQGALRTLGHAPLSPMALRTFMSAAAYGTEPAAADRERIGVMPDLCKAVNQLRILPPATPHNLRIIP